MKYINVNFFLSAVLALSSGCIASEVDEGAIVESKRNLPSFIKANFKGIDYNLVEVKIILVPHVTLNSSSFNGDISRLDNELRIDSIGYGIIKDKSNIVVDIVRTYSFKTITSAGRISDELQTTKKIDLVIEKYSKNPFFLSLGDENTNQIIAFFVHDKVRFLNAKMEPSGNFDSLIITRVGSLDKYKEIIALNRSKETLRKRLSDRAAIISVLQKDYIEHMNNFPKDTTVIIDKLLNEIAASASTTIPQKNLLRHRLLTELRSGRLIPSCVNGIPLYDYDVTNCIREVLTRDQLNMVLSKHELNSWFTATASEKLYRIIYEEKVVSPDEIRKVMIKEIYGK